MRSMSERSFLLAFGRERERGLKLDADDVWELWRRHYAIRLLKYIQSKCNRGLSYTVSIAGVDEVALEIMVAVPLALAPLACVACSDVSLGQHRSSVRPTLA